MKKKENNPIVNVIIATYNGAQHIKKAIESALNQTYKNIEIIVVDDGSTDNTKKILESYIKTKKIKYFYQKNAGSGNARDNGIKKSQGKYIAVLDSDDVWCDIDKLKKQVNFLEEHSDYILVGGGMIYIDEKKEEINRSIPLENDKDIRESMLLENVFSHSTVVFARNVWGIANGYCGEGDRANEWNLWLKLGKLGKFYNFQEYFACYLIGKQNTSSYNKQRIVKLNIEMEKRHRNDYPHFWKAFFLNWIYYFYLFFPLKKHLRSITSKLK